MLDEKEIDLIVTSAMSKYASENNGRKGLSKTDIITLMIEHDGDMDDVRIAMARGISKIMMKANVTIRIS